MTVLKRGMSGAAVKRLQKTLKEKGFDPGKMDGDFGGGTEAALMAFQLSEGLLADGIAGPRSLTALGLEKKEDVWPDVMPGVRVQAVSGMFPATPIGNIRENLPPVCAALSERGLTDQPMVLMALATIRAETESFEPVAEGRSRFNTSPRGHPFDLYDNRRDLGNQGTPDGERFRGRGYVQLTGRFNYQRYGELLGLGKRLIDEPELASDAAIAGRLLAAFLKDKEIAIKQALLADDLRHARRLVNGGSHGLDRFTDAFRRGQRLIPAG
ncbi:peptidoglycan-binding protein [Azoarcus sp. DD4]|uniref:peptidoglycan-binding protein n=1 Tax=Azoarcus sp. DD4 TaxID=2027405 RepID=UPI00112AC36A|nr:peptidoglycan-binding protein [Azoarcus sp. DD4]QDF99546.1 peptidoglycan-binding protein [Azoarcus sp. DD4]